MINVEEHLPLVNYTIKKYNLISIARPYGFDHDELYSIGCLELVRCAQRFDESKDIQFSTYAITTIRLAILTFLRDNRLIRVNRRTAQNFTRIYKYIDGVVRDEGYEPDTNRICDELHLTSEDVKAAQCSLHTVSMDQKIRGVEDAIISDVLADEDAEFEDVTLLLVRIKEALTDAEYKLFSQYFLEGKDQKVLAPEYNISQVSVSRRIRKIREKLQKVLFEEYKEVI